MNPWPRTTAIAGFWLVLALPGWAREWTDATGKFSVEAELVAVGGGEVDLRKPDGSVIRVAVTRLSEADQRYLKSLSKRPNNEPALPAPEVITAWTEAGAEFGWAQQWASFFKAGAHEPPRNGTPTFHFRQIPKAGLRSLPVPEVPFGLWITCPVSSMELKALAKFQNLRLLYIRPKSAGAAPLTDADLKQVAALTQLQQLDLAGARITDAGLQSLTAFEKLQSVNLDRTQVTDQGMKALAGLTHLQALSLNGTQITDAGLPELADLAQIQSLSLGSTRLTDAGLQTLARLKQLTVLRLNNNPLSDTGLKELAGLTNLEHLELGGTKITDAGLKQLASLKRLRLLYLGDTQVSDAAIEELQKALPTLAEKVFR